MELEEMVRTEVARVVGEHLANAKVTFVQRKHPTPRPRVMPCGVPQSQQIQAVLGKLPPGKGATVSEICEALGTTKKPTIATAAHRLVRRGLAVMVTRGSFALPPVKVSIPEPEPESAEAPDWGIKL